MWGVVLEAAAEWGCPPWVVTGEELTPARRVRWFFRWAELRKQRGMAR